MTARRATGRGDGAAGRGAPRRRAVRGAAVLALAAVLGGCGLIPGRVPDTPIPPEQWDALPSCGTAENAAPWVLVDDFPVDQVVGVGAGVVCGDTFLTGDGRDFTGVGIPEVSPGELDELRARFEDAGFELVESSFREPESGDDAGLVGTLVLLRGELSSGSHEYVYLVNYWDGVTPVTYYTYVDWESPLTRAIAS